MRRRRPGCARGRGRPRSSRWRRRARACPRARRTRGASSVAATRPRAGCARDGCSRGGAGTPGGRSRHDRVGDEADDHRGADRDRERRAPTEVVSDARAGSSRPSWPRPPTTPVSAASSAWRSLREPALDEPQDIHERHRVAGTPTSARPARRPAASGRSRRASPRRRSTGAQRERAARSEPVGGEARRELHREIGADLHEREDPERARRHPEAVGGLPGSDVQRHTVEERHQVGADADRPHEPCAAAPAVLVGARMRITYSRPCADARRPAAPRRAPGRAGRADHPSSPHRSIGTLRNP